MAKKDFFKAFMAYKCFTKKKETENQDMFINQTQKKSAELASKELDHENRIINANNLYQKITTECGYREQLGDNTQMLNDLWLHALGEFVKDDGLRGCDDREQLLDEMVDKFLQESAVNGNEHLLNLDINTEYEEYIEGCFEGEGRNPGFFWILLGSMSGNDGEYTKDTIQFTKDYCEFINALAEYMIYRFSGSYFKGLCERLINDMLDKSCAFSGVDDPYENYQMPNITNPLV